MHAEDDARRGPLREPASSEGHRLEAAEALLVEALGDDADLGSDVLERLCAAHPDLAEALRRVHPSLAAVRGLIAHAARGDALGQRIPDAPIAGRFRVLDEIGRGGMSVVLSAWDDVLRREVALKYVRRPADPAPDAPSRIARRRARLVNEAQVLAQLEHPGIVAVHDCVRGEDGEPYVALQLVRGVDLREVYRRHRAGDPEWTLPRVVGLLQKACEAVAFAHSRGVLHRDLKPANVMVGSFGETLVMDWGLARTGAEGAHPVQSPGSGDRTADDASVDARVITDRDDPSSSSTPSLFTQDGDVIGTPTYMSPEQADGRYAAVDERSDVYGVGAMLYELLAGRAPYETDAGTPAPRELLRLVRTGAPAPIGRLARLAPLELVAIAERAMQRDPRRRYRTMRALAGDLRAFLEGRVVRAHRTGAVVELRKWISRNPLASTALGLVLVGAVAFALVQGRTSRALSSTLADMRERGYRQQVGLAAAALRTGDSGEAQRLLAATEPELRGWEWHYLIRELTRASWSTATGHVWSMSLAFDPDGATLAVVGGNPRSMITRLDALTGERIAESAPQTDVVYGLGFDGRGALCAVRGRDEIVELDPVSLDVHDTPRVRGLASVHGGLRLFQLLVDAPGERFFVAGEDGRVSIWSSLDGAHLSTLEQQEGQAHGLALTPDGRHLVTTYSHGEACVWDTQDGGLVARLQGRGARIDAVAVSPGGDHVALGDWNGNVWVVALDDDAASRTIARLPLGVTRIRWSATTGVVAVAAGTAVHLYDPESWRLRTRLLGHGQAILALALSPDGRMLGSVGIDGEVRAWDLQRMVEPEPVARHGGVFDRVAFDPASGEGLLIYDDGEVAVWDPGLRRERRRLRVQPPGVVRDSQVAPDGRWLASVSVAGEARVTDLDTGATLRAFPPAPERHDQCAVDRARQRVFLATRLGDLAAVDLDLEGGRDRPAWCAGPFGAVHDMTLAPDAQHIVLSAESTITVIDARTGVTVWMRRFASGGAVLIQDVDPSGSRLLLRQESGTLHLVDLEDGRTLWSVESLGGVFDRSGRRVFTRGPAGELVVVDASEGERLADLPAGVKQLVLLAVSPDGTTVLGVGADGVPAVWRGPDAAVAAAR